MQDREIEHLSRRLSFFLFFLEAQGKDLIECFQKAFANKNQVRWGAATGYTKHQWDEATLEILLERKVKAEYPPRVHLLKVIDSAPISAFTGSFHSQACK